MVQPAPKNILPASLGTALAANLLLACLLLACSNEKVAAKQAGSGLSAEPADSGQLSGTLDAATLDDLGGDDSAVTTIDAADVGAPACPGGPQCPCQNNEMCDNGICLEFLAGKQCASPCVSDGGCPSGTTCKQFGGADTSFVCVSNFVTLCAPCMVDLDCTYAGASSLCLDYGAEGKFCGGACAVDGDCPADYACAGILDASTGKTVQQCKRKPGSNGQTVCPCSTWASAAGHTTACGVGNAFGSCKGKRTCTAGGLTACDAKTPALEVCNADDDDCDGKIDDLPADATCAVKAFSAGGSGSACAGDADCAGQAGEMCDGGKCKPLIGACPGTPTCSSSGLLVCINAKTPKLEQCDGDDNDCDGQIDEGFAWTGADGGTAAVGQACGAGACLGGTVQCATLGSSVCTTANKAKDETCNGLDDDCDGKIDQLACDDNDACTADSCDPASGTCSHEAAVDCDDANQCTTDTCSAKTGLCSHAAYSGSCSDGDSCTAGDACQAPGDSTPTCAPGAAVACDDANICTDDSCDAKTGCVHAANAGTLACYDGAAGTKGVGTCKSGIKACVDSNLGACVGQVLPNAVEACDGNDDSCNGLVDEGCKAGGVTTGFATAAGGSGGAWLEFATGTPTGMSGDASGKAGWWGLLHWFVAVFQ